MKSVSGCVALGVVDLMGGALVEWAEEGPEALEDLRRAHTAVMRALAGSDGPSVAGTLARLRSGLEPRPGGVAPESGREASSGAAFASFREIVVRTEDRLQVLSPCPGTASGALLVVCTGVTNLGGVLAEARRAARSCTL